MVPVAKLRFPESNWQRRRLLVKYDDRHKLLVPGAGKGTAAVLAALTMAPSEGFTQTDIIGLSEGSLSPSAIAGACNVLVAVGHVEIVCKVHRYDRGRRARV